MLLDTLAYNSEYKFVWLWFYMWKTYGRRAEARKLQSDLWRIQSLYSIDAAAAAAKWMWSRMVLVHIYFFYYIRPKPRGLMVSTTAHIYFLFRSELVIRSRIFVSIEIHYLFSFVRNSQWIPIIANCTDTQTHRNTHGHYTMYSD